MLSFVLFILRLNYKPKLHHWRPEKPPEGSLAFCPTASAAVPGAMRRCCPARVDWALGTQEEARLGVEVLPPGQPPPGPGLCISNLRLEGRWLGRPSLNPPMKGHHQQSGRTALHRLNVPHCLLLSCSVLCYPTLSLDVPGCPLQPHAALHRPSHAAGRGPRAERGACRGAATTPPSPAPREAGAACG